MRCIVLALLAACSAGSGSEMQLRTARVAEHALDMNDVSILLPLPRDVGTPVLAALSEPGLALIEPRWFDALVSAHGDIAPRTGGAIALTDFQVVAVRFDLCERAVAGPCPADVTGRLRLVLQPLYVRAEATFAHDVALHALYAIPPSEMSGVVDELRRLSRSRAEQRDGLLSVNPSAASGDARYLGRLRTLVLRYARAAELVRLTVIGQVADSAAFAWIFRGADRAGDELVPMVIPGVSSTQQTVQLAGGDTVYRADTIADIPSGFVLATNGPRFRNASRDQQRDALAALVALQNPSLHGTDDTQCIGCHLATYLTARRAGPSGVDPRALPGWFASTRARAVRTIADEDPRVVRAFGWAGNAPAISQRVANDTAQVLSEIEARFPARGSP